MIAKARAVNARLRGKYPAGYELDATHAPHITLLQRFVREKDFDAVTAAVSKVLAAERPAVRKVRAWPQSDPQPKRIRAARRA